MTLRRTFSSQATADCLAPACNIPTALQRIPSEQMVSSTHAFRFGYFGFRGTIAACELKHRSGKPLFKALRCDRSIAFYANFSCLFAFGDSTST
ncbi:hypothetical protein AVEN_159515-1 [Araneus ventricosus]|uniref:Uncharacterized protein n=1 Tax=Araneus ventricosus TaxID=182803 RepID=A0A4Y2A1B0_ARAVE|nr:hypothetical protein AVEN_159515-1 [Araneus ventricosus]